MKYLLLISVILFTGNTQAEIYVCKDVKNKVTYQDTTCATKTVRTIAKAPDVSLEDQIKARVIQEKARESSRKYQELLALQRLEQDRINLEYEKLELEKRRLALLESQIATDNQLIAPQYVFNPWYQSNQLRNRYLGQRAHKSNSTFRNRHTNNGRAYINY